MFVKELKKNALCANRHLVITLSTFICSSHTNVKLYGKIERTFTLSTLTSVMRFLLAILLFKSIRIQTIGFSLLYMDFRLTLQNCFRSKSSIAIEIEIESNVNVKDLNIDQLKTLLYANCAGSTLISRLGSTLCSWSVTTQVNLSKFSERFYYISNWSHSELANAKATNKHIETCTIFRPFVELQEP